MNLVDRLIWDPISKKVATRVKDPVVEGIRAAVEQNKELKKDAFQGFPYAPATGMPIGVQRYQFDYNHQGTQMRRKPQSNISFQILREFSTSYEVARACINARKRQITGLDWEIVPLDEGKSSFETKQNAVKYADDITLVRNFFLGMGGPNVRFRNLLDMIIEDLLVLDAVALLRHKTKGGDLMYLTPIDAATIKLVVDDFGNTPLPPDPAYKQVIRGAITDELTTDQMIYDMMNPRSSTPYGLAPLESLIIVVSSALRGNLFNLNYLTDGNIPEGIMSMPQDWSPQQIKEFQEVWDAYIAGDARAGSRLRFTPGGPGVGYTATKKRDEMAFGEFQQWLMLCTCAMFDIQPQTIGFTLHHSTKANASEQGDIQTKRGILPLTNFLRETFRDVIQKELGFPHLDFDFRGMEDRDALQEAQAHQVEIFTGLRTIDEIRKDEGWDPIGIDEPFVVGNPSFLKAAMESEEQQSEEPVSSNEDGTGQDTTAIATDDGDASKPDDSGGTATTDPAQENVSVRDAGDSMNQKSMAIDLMHELRKFQTYAINRRREGKSLRTFESEIIDKSTLDDLNDQLQKTTTPTEVKTVLNTYRSDIRLRELVAAEELREALNKVTSSVNQPLSLQPR